MPRLLWTGVMYPQHYVWFVFLAALDVIVTRIALHFGAREANPIAEALMLRWDLPGLIVLKFGVVAFVLVLCEWIGRRSVRAGRRLAEWAVAISAVPVAVGLLQLVAATLEKKLL